MLQFASTTQAIQKGKGLGWGVCFYGLQVLDISPFLQHHPAGPQLLEKYLGFDLREPFSDPLLHQHLPLSSHVLKGLVKGIIRPRQPSASWYDLSRALIPQVMELSQQDYMSAIRQPLCLGYSPRMFQHPVLQYFSRNGILSVLLVYGLLQLHLFYDLPRLQASTFVRLALGLPLWTLIQYLLHRFVMHCDQHLPDGPLWRAFHFSIHSIHHMLPFDLQRTAFPPLLGAVLVLILKRFVIVPLAGPQSVATIMGTHFGYLLYDAIHYMVHCQGQHFSWLRAHHTKHHFVDQSRAFGVSAPAWDWVFGTRIGLKQN